MKEYIDSILISKKKRILNKGGNDYLLTIQLITGFHRLNYILSFERDQLILIENEEKSHTKSLYEFVKLWNHLALPLSKKRKKKQYFNSGRWRNVAFSNCSAVILRGKLLSWIHSARMSRRPCFESLTNFEFRPLTWISRTKYEVKDMRHCIQPAPLRATRANVYARGQHVADA